MARCVKFALLPTRFASLFTAFLTLAFTAKRMASFLLAFGIVPHELTFLIETDGLAFFGSALASRSHSRGRF